MGLDSGSDQRKSITRFSASGFYHESVCPMYLNNLLDKFLIFTKINGDIRKKW
jgi:hypothetical protein